MDNIHAGNGSEVYEPSNLLAGSKPPVTKTVMVTGALAMLGGALLGKITADGRFTLSKSASGDGSQVPDAILAHDADASAGDVEAVIYVEGEFNQDALTYGSGHTAASVAQGLRERGIHLRVIN